MIENEYVPDRWVMIKFESKEDITYKILAGWSGSYLHGQSWKLNSGVIKIDEDDYYYNFYGHSGSIYRCHKEAYGMNMIMLDRVKIWDKQILDSLSEESIVMSVLPEDTKFMEINYE